MEGKGTPVIGLGLAALGRPEYINIDQNEGKDKSELSFKKNAMEVLDFAYKQGIRYYDTAPSYGKGEQFLSEWYQLHKRADLSFGTKWGYTYVADWQIGYEGPHEIKEHSVTKLQEQWSVSQKLLPALQVYQIHSATLESGVLQNQKVLDKLYEIKRETGLKIGITTSGPQQTDVINKALEIYHSGSALFDSFQVTYNILEQDTFSVLQEAKRTGKIIIIKEALANGRLFPNPRYPNYQSLYSVLQALAGRFQVGIDAIALRFCMDSLGPQVVLSGASNKRQLAQNLKALEFTLDPQHLAALNLENSKAAHQYWEERSKLTWD